MTKKSIKILFTEFMVASAILFAFVGCAEQTTEAIVVAKDGINGKSCLVSDEGLVTCGDSTFQLPNGIGIVGYVHPCGIENANEEVFLRLSDGNVLMVFDGGASLDRLALMAPMTYVTTDRTGTQCYVTMDTNKNVTSRPTPATGAATWTQ